MYTPPPRATIESQIITKYESELGTTIPLIRRAFVRITAITLSGPFWLLHQLVAWAMKQIFIQFMSPEYLQYLADWYGLPRKSATTAIITATVAGTNGKTVDAGTFATYGSLVFSTRSAVVITDGSASVELSCLTAGSAGNVSAGTVLGFPHPLDGVDSMTVSALSVTAIDQEALEDWRARIKSRMQVAPQGGAAGDYVRWALEVSGIVAAHAKRAVTDIFVYPLVAKTGADRVPDTAKLAEVQTYLQYPGRRPLCATVYSAAATERTVSATITGLSPNDEATKARIVEAFDTYVYAAYPKQFTDEINPTDVLSAGSVWAMIIAQGAIASAVSLTISGIGSVVTSYQLPIGEIAKPGSITWA